MVILVTGCDGYIGNAVTQRLLKKHTVVGVDSFIKYKWAHDVDSFSIIPVKSIYDKVSIFKQLGDFYFHRTDIVSDADELEEIFKHYKFDVVINLAQQPSAGYSQKSLAHAIETINNNTNGTLNLLWMIKQYCPDAHFIEIESLGTIQPDINTDIPEDDFVFQYEGRSSSPSLFPRRPSSFYHASKVMNTYLNDAACRWWGLKVTAINQGVVYGAYTPEIDQTGVYSHLWIDDCFGTLVHRFIVQALIKHPFTIYGEGNQSRGFLALNDSVQCIELFVNNPPTKPGLRSPNQIYNVYSVNDVADKVNNILINDRMYIKSPRSENTNSFYYNPITDTILKLGFTITRTIEQEIEYCINKIDKSLLNRIGHLIMPKVMWK